MRRVGVRTPGWTRVKDVNGGRYEHDSALLRPCDNRRSRREPSRVAPRWPRRPHRRSRHRRSRPGSERAGSGRVGESQAEWLRIMKSGGCWSCHQLGSKGTREIPAALGSFPSSVAAWQRRLQSGQAGAQMMGTVSQLGAQRAFAMFADWTDRIAAGEVPPPPPRPRGVERNVVITEWDWADPKAYLHDEVSTDRRHPTIHAHGSLYGSLELSADYLPVLDPTHNAAGRVPLTVRDPNTAPAGTSPCTIRRRGSSRTSAPASAPTT